jgi:hypothetical protein
MANMGKTLAFTAVGGILAGVVGCAGGQEEAKDPNAVGAEGQGAKAAGDTAAADKCSCKGKNECKGKGECKVEGKQACKGQNECKGQGGCKSADCAKGHEAAPAGG